MNLHNSLHDQYRNSTACRKMMIKTVIMNNNSVFSGALKVSLLFLIDYDETTKKLTDIKYRN
jgi:hypothetical protein